MDKARKKVRTLIKVYKDKGFLGLVIVAVEYLQKKSRRKPNSKHKYRIDTGALYEDILAADLTKQANRNWKAPQKKKSHITINWLMPPPGKGSGGHMTLFRFIKYFEDSGHTCRLYFHKPGPGSTVKGVLDAMGDSFPPIKASMQWLQPSEEMAPADAIFATSWETAYTVYASVVNAKKFYFVQDFEPYFYPVGGHSMLAENTYRLGLRGITAGGWLESKLKKEYGMVTTKFDFGSDGETYRYTNDTVRKEIVFYARPTTPRRAFELGVVALDLFHRKHPEYTINFIGWDVSDIEIPFPYKNLGILTREELNELYGKCAVSLVMSLTNMSLLPLELLSSGCIPVVTDGENNRMVSDNPYIQYCQADPASLATAIAAVVNMPNLQMYAKKAAESVSAHSWDESGETVVKTVLQSVNRDGEA